MILKEIASGENAMVQDFFIRQLNYFGGQASLDQLSAYLTDEELQDPAIRAIRDIDPEKAADLFAAQLQNCQGRCQVALVNALKNTGKRSHADAVAALAGSGSTGSIHGIDSSQFTRRTDPQFCPWFRHFVRYNYPAGICRCDPLRAQRTGTGCAAKVSEWFGNLWGRSR